MRMECVHVDAYGVCVWNLFVTPHVVPLQICRGVHSASLPVPSLLAPGWLPVRAPLFPHSLPIPSLFIPFPPCPLPPLSLCSRTFWTVSTRCSHDCWPWTGMLPSPVCSPSVTCMHWDAGTFIARPMPTMRASNTYNVPAGLSSVGQLGMPLRASIIRATTIQGPCRTGGPLRSDWHAKAKRL